MRKKCANGNICEFFILLSQLKKQIRTQKDVFVYLTNL